jgi:hypothetical protein
VPHSYSATTTIAQWPDWKTGKVTGSEVKLKLVRALEPPDPRAKPLGSGGTRLIYLTSRTTGRYRERLMPARCPLHHEQPVVVPHVMHPTCRFSDVSSVHSGAILQGLLSLRHALLEPSDNATRTEHGHSEPPAPPNSRDFWSARPGSNPCLVTVTFSPAVSHSSQWQVTFKDDAPKTCSLRMPKTSLEGFAG